MLCIRLENNKITCRFYKLRDIMNLYLFFRVL